jgi:hypothetical protein
MVPSDLQEKCACYVHTSYAAEPCPRGSLPSQQMHRLLGEHHHAHRM